MIVGFPGETAEDFEETLSLTEAAQYHSMFSFKYSARPNTLASKRMPDDVSEAEKTARIVALQALQREIQTRLHEQAVGTTMDVLVDAASRRREAEISGRTSGNTVVNFPAAADDGRTARTAGSGGRCRSRLRGRGRTACGVNGGRDAAASILRSGSRPC